MRRIVGLIIAAALALTLAPFGTSPAAATPLPPDGVVFNNPKGSKAAKYRIATQIGKAISNATPGSTISMAQYLFNNQDLANRLIAAHKRRVNVQMIIDRGEGSKQIRQLKRELGTNIRARSFVATCRRGCMSNLSSTMHAKIYLFSYNRDGRKVKRYVSMVASGNPHKVNTEASWNNMHTFSGNKKLYDSLRKYFVDMKYDRTNHNYFRTTSSGKYTLYYYPRRERTARDVVILQALRNVNCRGVAKGYGSDGRTIVKVAMWGWTAARLDVARQLYALHAKGCKVEAITNRARTGPKVYKQLLKRHPSRGRIKVYDAWYDKNNNGYASLYIHHKLVAVNGRMYGNPRTKLVFTGSTNFTGSGTKTNNDVTLRIKDTKTYNAYAENFAYIRRNWTRRLYSVPPPTPKREGVREVDPDVLIESESLTDR